MSDPAFFAATGSLTLADIAVAAGAVLPEGAHVPDGMLAVGVPARVVRTAPSSGNAQRYVQNARRFQAGMQELSPGPVLHPGNECAS